jgi:hypothetical protein
MPPALAAAHTLRALSLGVGLGLFYSFLKPLRPRLTTLAGLVFLIFLGWSWLYLAFGICAGDLRLGFFFALGAGCFLTHRTLGRFLTPLFSGFWAFVGEILKILSIPWKYFFNFF